MAFEHKDGYGSLFKNDRRRSGSKDPEYTGSCKIDGQEYWLAGWIRDSRNGKFFNLTIKPKDEAGGNGSNGGGGKSKQSEPEGVDDEIPF